MRMVCPVCGNTRCRKINGKNKYELLQCRLCGHGFIAPLPTEKEIAGYYEDKSAYAPYDDYFDYFETKTQGYAERIAGIIDARMERYSNGGRKLLDFGCGSGLFMRHVLQRGWDASGTDIGEWARRAADKYKLNICTEADIDKYPFEKESFDVLTALDVIEHVSDPVQVIGKCLKYLKKDGTFFVTVPHISSIHAKLLGGKWGLFTPPLHIHYFSLRSSKRFFDLLGVELLDISTTFVSGFGVAGMTWLNGILQPLCNSMKLGDIMIVSGRKR